MYAYSFSEVKQNINSIFEQAIIDGAVQIKGEDSQIFMLTPVAAKKSPLDVAGVALDLTADEIVDFIHEGRKQFYGKILVGLDTSLTRPINN